MPNAGSDFKSCVCISQEKEEGWFCCLGICHDYSNLTCGEREKNPSKSGSVS